MRHRSRAAACAARGAATRAHDRLTADACISRLRTVPRSSGTPRPAARASRWCGQPARGSPSSAPTRGRPTSETSAHRRLFARPPPDCRPRSAVSAGLRCADASSAASCTRRRALSPPGPRALASRGRRFPALVARRISTFPERCRRPTSEYRQYPISAYLAAAPRETPTHLQADLLARDLQRWRIGLQIGMLG